MGTSTAEEKVVLRFGLTEVHAPDPPSSAQVDLVFVHGLNGDPKNTWTSKETHAFWPRDFLPEFIEDQKGRVLVYGYDADVASLGSGVSKDKLHNHSERLVADLFANRRIRKATERPIIFIAHSLGGLIVKRALIASAEVTGAKTEHLRSIYVSTYGILFLGTPHKGSDLGKWGTYLTWLCQAVLPNKLANSEPQLVEALKLNSETLINIDRQFAQLMDDFHIFFLHEAKPTNLKGTLHFIVDEDSAAPALPDVERAGIQADHSHMCKFDSPVSPGFDLVIDGIQRYADDSPSVIRNRWVMEKRERLTRAVRKAQENYPVVLDKVEVPLIPDPGSSDDPSPSISAVDLSGRALQTTTQASSGANLQQPHRPTEPFFHVPPGFRANTFFVGMEKEMHELDRSLFDSRRKDGTACVLLHGQPGSGKSHVARQYVYKNRYKFQGGVFWINAHLLDEVYRDYWQIHQRVIAKVAPEYIHNSSENLGKTFLDDVREWFSERDDWLIVFDGVTVENDVDVTALQQCIPDSPNCGIIYVSRSRRLESMQRLLRPHAIKIAGLKEQDARDLLFKELGLRNPRETQIKAAKALVKKVGGLPLAVSAIARRLADTHEPIEKFHLKSYSDDPKLGGTYNHILSDLEQNNHREAISLMNVLCFFGPQIPVEMIHLGLQALRADRIEVRANEEGGTRDLNITFGILMRHALIERNEPDDSESMSSSRGSVTDPEPIDVLNLQAVIQKFWSDSLNASKQLPLWLGRSIALLNTSYQQATVRMTQQAKPGRASDFRWYLVHARCLRQHCKVYESRHQRMQDLKDDLDVIIGQIESEIRAREPGSSQESIEPAEFQASVFDRTSTSSSSGPSQASPDEPTPDSPPMELDPYQPSQYVSPTYLDGVVLDPRLAALGADYRFPIIYSVPMENENSSSTVRPEPSGGVLHNAFIPSPTRDARVSPQRRDSFRSASATAVLYPDHAVGSISTSPYSQKPGDPEGLTYAMSSLTGLHARSLSAASGGRGNWSRTPPKASDDPLQQQGAPSIRNGLVGLPVSQGMSRGFSAPSGTAKLPAEGSSPLRPDFARSPLLSSENLQAVIEPTTAATSRSSQMQPPAWAATGIHEAPTNTFGPALQGPNPMPLPYERDVSVQSISSHLRSRQQSKSPSRGGRALLRQDPRLLSQSFRARELAERDANLNLRAFNLNRRNNSPGTKDFEHRQSPDMLAMHTNRRLSANQPFYDQSGSALGAYDQGLLQIQNVQQLQALQRSGIVDQIHPPTLGTAAGMVNSAVLPIDAATATRLGVPYGPPYALYQNISTGIDPQGTRRRRRTLSAPESPGTQMDKKMWEQ